MLRSTYILQRLMLVIPTLLGVSIVIFVIMRLLPGDVAHQILTGGGTEQGVTEEQVSKLRHELGLDAPILVQYARWLSSIVRLDPGRSLQPSQDRIRDLLVERAPVTAEPAIGAILVALLIALPLGILSAVFQNTRVDYLLREDYVRTARAKGLRFNTVIVRHVLRNAMLPVITIAGLQFGTLLGGAVILESIFALSGLGLLILDTILKRDYPTVQAIVMLTTMVYVLINLDVDLAYAWVEPRIRYG